MIGNKSPAVAIITATLNCEGVIHRLAHSLKNQSDQDFEWVICDGCSVDDTLKIVQGCNMPQVRILSREDFGIYDALNYAIQNIQSKYYVVAGADDSFAHDAIKLFKQSLIFSPEMAVHAFSVFKGGQVISSSSKPAWLIGHKALVAEHSVATLFHRDLHELYGYYSHDFSIAADHDFIIRCWYNSVQFIRRSEVVGDYGLQGVSNQKSLLAATQSFAVQSQYFLRLPQLVLFVIRAVRIFLRRS